MKGEVFGEGPTGEGLTNRPRVPFHINPVYVDDNEPATVDWAAGLEGAERDGGSVRFEFYEGCYLAIHENGLVRLDDDESMYRPFHLGFEYTRRRFLALLEGLGVERKGE